MWSQRILDNWNLYKRERDRKPPAPKGESRTAPPGKGWVTREQLEAETRRVAQLYENSTSWKLTPSPAGIGPALETIRRNRHARHRHHTGPVRFQPV